MGFLEGVAAGHPESKVLSPAREHRNKSILMIPSSDCDAGPGLVGRVLASDLNLPSPLREDLFNHLSILEVETC